MPRRRALKRRLVLRRDALTELTPADLASVAAGAAGASGLTCPVVGCVANASDDLSCVTQCFAYTCGCNTAPC